MILPILLLASMDDRPPKLSTNAMIPTLEQASFTCSLSSPEGEADTFNVAVDRTAKGRWSPFTVVKFSKFEKLSGEYDLSPDLRDWTLTMFDPKGARGAKLHLLFSGTNENSEAAVAARLVEVVSEKQEKSELISSQVTLMTGHCSGSMKYSVESEPQ
jgi:hypothetical protein